MDFIVFVWVFFLCTQDNSWTAALALIKFCRHIYLDNLQNPIEFQGRQRSRSHVFLCVFLCAWCCCYPRTVLSLEQGLMILLYFAAGGWINVMKVKENDSAIMMWNWFDNTMKVISHNELFVLWAAHAIVRVATERLVTERWRFGGIKCIRHFSCLRMFCRLLSVLRCLQLTATAFALGSSQCFTSSFLRQAITAHLYQCQQTVVIGRDADRINLVCGGLLASFVSCVRSLVHMPASGR